MPARAISRHRFGSVAVLILAAVVGGVSFTYYYLHGLTVVHYDAKAHLVVARRIIDSVAPGYSQMGAHWLPLIHLLYLPLVAVDSQYHSAFLPSLLSVFAFVISVWMVYRIAARLAGSLFSGFFAAAILLANQNLQFLQSAPLTEPVYIALSLLAMDALLRWREEGKWPAPWLPATWAALAAMCRYEGWLFIGGSIALIACDSWMRRIAGKHAFRAVAVYLGVFCAPVAAHFGYIHYRLGDSFFQRVARGNPAPYETFKRPLLSIAYHFGELAQAAGIIPLLIALSGLALCLFERDRLRDRFPFLLLWFPSLANIAALYWGLIYRVRYSALLLPAVAVFGGLVLAEGKPTRRITILTCLAVFLLPWVSWVFPASWDYHLVYRGNGIILLPVLSLIILLAALAQGWHRPALLSLAVLAMQLPVFDGELRPMLAESKEHEYIEPEQRQVLAYLASHYDGSRILIDVGQLAPLMYDSDLPLREYVYHDGDTTDWDAASAHPLTQVGWLCAEKGDEVWRLLHVDPHWADGYSLAVQTENYLLYQRGSQRAQVPTPGGQLQ
jgi:hypothetical protein